MRELINKEIERLEQKKDIRVLYACESGSRAWGFPSKDSDYDARFIYVHRRDWYLSLDTCSRRDQVEVPITNDLDIAGWELRKSLNLLKKSNAAILEWIDSPIVYKKVEPFYSQLRAMRQSCYNPMALMGHYYGMSLKALESVSKDAPCKLKKLFYALRAALALEWSYRDLGPVPMLYKVMVEGVIEDAALKRAIYGLEEQKLDATEATLVEVPDSILDFLGATIAKHKTFRAPWVRIQLDKQTLNQIFLEAIG